MRTYNHRHLLVLAMVVVSPALALKQATQSVPPARDGDTVVRDTVEEETTADPASLDFVRLKEIGARGSRYLAPRFAPEPGVAPAADLAIFQDSVWPILNKACLPCHGPSKAKGGVRVDELDPDLFQGEDVDWWLDVLSVLSNGEMPPPGETELSSGDRSEVIEWLSTEVQLASSARRSDGNHSTFRRMTRYEYEYALQDLLGLPYRFADDLPPDPTSDEGFQNSSELLHLTPTQLQTYFDSNRKAVEAATIRGEEPTPLFWNISMEAAAEAEWERQNGQVAGVRKKHAEDPGKLEQELVKLRERFAKRPRATHYESLATGRVGKQSWHYDGAKFAWAPTEVAPGSSSMDPNQPIDRVGIIPRGQGMILELGERIPEEGTLRVRVLASRADGAEGPAPSLRLAFGWQASNDSRAVVRISERDLAVAAVPGTPQVYEFQVPLREVTPRNWVRKTAKMGGLPSPSEYVKLINASVTGGPIRVHRVEVAAPIYEAWPPASHTRLFPASDLEAEIARAAQVLAGFMPRAWRRAPSAEELASKLRLFERIRPASVDFEAAMTEVMATILTSPHFLFVGLNTESHAAESADDPASADVELATRLSLFLWCSTPDAELLALAGNGELAEAETLRSQVDRMLADPKAERFSRHFVRQWLGLSLLDYLQVDAKAYPRFNSDLKEAMAHEPIAFFEEVLSGNLSVLEFLHADFTVADERLARHYGIEGVKGNDFQRVSTGADPLRGGLLTQAGLLAMNSDGKDSHPLKRGVWMLERLLNDPPPPPPPAVPEINLADPRIAEMTLKERIEDHRNDAACMSCHAKIDPWGIAFENYDASGIWRTEVQGKPVDASSVLFNGQELDGMAGLKTFLLEKRQDQFVRALVHKLTGFAIGRPLSFEDRAAVEAITAEVRKGGDRLATMVSLIVTSDLFRSE